MTDNPYNYPYSVTMLAENLSEDEILSACIEYFGMQSAAKKRGHGWYVDIPNKFLKKRGGLKKNAKVTVYLQNKDDAGLIRWII